ncbi:MAG: peptidyl-prolyl cis-trans isomerase, partial [Salinibacter sp.]
RKRRRNTLVGAMTNRIYENLDKPPTDEEVRTYFERHRNQLTLREPYVRVRHLTTTTTDSARAARQALTSTAQSAADSVWARLSEQYGQNPARSKRLADRFLPQSRLFSQLPYVRDELEALQDGETAPVIEDNNRFHVLQLVRRIPEGTEPELRWVEAEIRRRLRVRRRKQMYAREVQRLRNRARADGLIDTP